MSFEDTHFLVVDDDGMVRDIIIQYLKSYGFKNIIEAKDGRAALKYVRNSAVQIDFIISDWEMPHVDGLTLLRAVRGEVHRKDTKFMMVTSQGSHERMKISKAAKSRVDAYIVKPFRSELFKEKIVTLLNGEIDLSSAQFEADILATPKSSVLVMEEKQKPGHVSFIPGTEPTGHINIPGGVNPHARVYKGGDFDPNKPPEEYEITQLNITLVLKLVNAYKKVKWLDKAMRLCKEADDHFPDNADILYNLGHCHFLLSEFTDAELALRKAVKVKPYHVESFTLLNEMQKLKKAS